LVCTWLKRHIHGRPRRILPPALTIRERRPLSMEIAKFSMEPLTDDLAIARDNRANEGIRTHLAPSELSKLQSPLQVLSIRSCKRGGHID